MFEIHTKEIEWNGKKLKINEDVAFQNLKTNERLREAEQSKLTFLKNKGGFFTKHDVSSVLEGVRS